MAARVAAPNDNNRAADAANGAPRVQRIEHDDAGRIVAITTTAA